jgi:hypothetical protein
MSAVVALPARQHVSTRARGGVWAVVGLLFAAVLVLAVAGSFIGSIAYEKIMPTSRAFAGSIRAVDIEIDNGSVTIEPVATTGAVVTSSGLSGLSSPSDTEHVTGGTLVVRSSCPTRFFENHCTRSYVLRIPSDVAVVADTGSGDVTTNGVDGPLRIRSGQGNVRVDGATGSVRIWSGQGEVTATGLRGATAAVTTGQGDVHLGFDAAPSEVQAISGQGDVTITLPRGAVAYRVRATSGQGVVTDTVAVNPSSRRTVLASSGQGDIAIRYR